MPLTAAIVPHAPALVPEVTPAYSDDHEDIRSAVASLTFEEAEAIVVVSPHALSTCVYERPAGSLSGFGVPRVAVERTTDEGLARALAARWNRPLMEGPADHGVTVPLMLGLGAGRPVVGVGLAEVTGPEGVALDDIADEARSLGEALRELGDDRALGLVASANTAAALTPAAPLTERADARAIERKMLEALAASLASIEALAAQLWLAGGSCAAGPLLTLAGACPEGRAVPLVYDHPFGVGYLVARVE